MIAQIGTGGVQGVDAYMVRVEVSAEGGNEALTRVVGLPEATVRESQVRIRSALRASGCPPQQGIVTINLAPAHIRKNGTAYDLPIALAMAASRGVVPAASLEGRVALGELSLDGRVRAVRGVLPVAMAARDAGVHTLLVPNANAREAAVVDGLSVAPIESVGEAIEILLGKKTPRPVKAPQDEVDRSEASVDLCEVRGQERARRALEIAAAGGHGILMQGPPGSGKSMLARRLTTILPSMTLEERLESTKIHSVAGLLSPGEGLVRARPFRAPHHTASDVALVGGGSVPRPGEISLAHNGVLFLDELPEFRRSVLEVLRQPIEEGSVTISRASMTVTFPSRFTLVAAMNPCPCGYYGDPRRKCRCSDIERQRYTGRISGPLLDRIDLQVTVAPVPFETLREERMGETSESVRARVEAARQRQRERLAPEGLSCNAEMGSRSLRHWCRLPASAEKVFERAMDRFALSARAHDRVLRVARTVADLAGAEDIGVEHLVEALELRGFS